MLITHRINNCEALSTNIHMNNSRRSPAAWALLATVCTGLAAAAMLLVQDVVGQQAAGGPTARFGDTPESLYAAACAACHGPDGRGRTASQLGFDIPLPNFTDCNFASREPDADWLSIIHEGGPVRGFDRKMPAFGEALSDEELGNALRQLRAFCPDESWPRGDLNFPLAMFTEKAFPEDEIVVKTFINAEGASAFEQEFIYEKRFGPRSQIEVSLPWVRADLGAPNGKEGGIGDLVLAFKHAIYHSLDTGSILSLGSELVLPTGDEIRGFGKGTAVLEPYILFGKMLPDDAFVQFHGALELPVESGFEDELVLRGAIGKTWTTGGPYGRAWTPMVEVLGAKELQGSASSQWDLVPQFQVTLNTRQHIIANFGVRVPVTDSSTRDTQFVFYLLWDWFDGGLTEGW